jgi:hypothetical protein
VKLENMMPYINKINGLDDKAYILMLIAYNASPTIARLKPSSLMVFKNNANRDLFSIWEKYKDDIKNSLKIDYYELKRTEKSIHVLLYDYINLDTVLRNRDNMAFLNRFGYSNEMDIYKLLDLLKKRYENVCPHEIGIFLGYPISDVMDFIECSNKECLMKGYWKVYNDLEKAREIFQIYDKSKIKVVNYIARKTKINFG